MITPSLKKLLERYEKRSRDLLRDVDVETTGTIYVSTRQWVHVTGSKVIEAVCNGEEARATAQTLARKRQEEAQESLDDKERMRLCVPIILVARARADRPLALRRVVASNRTAHLYSLGQ